MDPNPYESPQAIEDSPAPDLPTKRRRRRKPLWGYGVAIMVGVLVISPFLAGPLAVLDDSGGIQMLIGGFLGLVVYGFLF